MASGRYIAGGGYGLGWYGTGWYWDPWFDAYTFIPGDGIFYSPFGLGFCVGRLVFIDLNDRDDRGQIVAQPELPRDSADVFV